MKRKEGLVASLQLKNVDDNLYSWLKQFSKNNNLSMSQQVVSMLKEYSKINQDKPSINPVDEFLDNTPYFDKATIDDFDCILKENRKNLNRFRDDDEIFT